MSQRDEWRSEPGHGAPAFHNSPSGRSSRSTSRRTRSTTSAGSCAGVNAAFNAAIAVKRIDAELAVVAQFHNTQLTLQRRLIHLASVEVGDAIGDLSGASNLDPASLMSFKDAQTQLGTRSPPRTRPPG
ncbi:MAG TPA: hypothetical protein VHT91_40000 [Kofleriaceae bacterium]|jgi:hypothetical protein|nr:hypothetical protein [Kofleriaceae bacterium]